MEKDIYIIENIEELFSLYNGEQNMDRTLTIIVCTKGELNIEIDMKHHKITPMQIMLYLPYHSKIIRHSASDDFEGKILCIGEQALIEKFNLSNNLWEKSFALKEHPVINISKDVASLFEYYGKLLYLRHKMTDRMYHREVTMSLLQAIIYELLNEVNVSTETPGKHLLKQGDILFKKFVTLLSDTEVKPRMVTWYAEQLHVTPKYLSTTCKKVSGKTANVWINQFMVKDISLLLKYSEKSIKEIAEYLNFPNLSFFGKYVKANLGVSPKEYRNSQRRK